MADPDQPLCGAGGDFTVRLDPVQAEQLRRTALAWGMTPEAALAGLVAQELTACAAAVAELLPGPTAPPTPRGVH